MSHLSYLPPGEGISTVYAHRPEIWDPFVAFTQALMRGPGPLEFVDRELIAAFVSGLEGCAYCYGAHGATAEAFGVPADLLAALLRDVDSAATPQEGTGTPVSPPSATFTLDERRRALLRFVRAMTVDATRITRNDVDAVLNAGWSEDALHDAIAIAGRYAMIARICMAHGIVVGPDALKEAGRRMADPNWRGPAKR